MSPPVRAHLISLSLVLGLTVSLVWGQAPTHFSLNSVNVTGPLLITSVGSGNSGTHSLLCHTTNAANAVCLFPDGTEITRSTFDISATANTFIYVYIVTSPTNFLRLRRGVNVRSPGGDYCCGSATNVNERLCINLVVDCATPPSIPNGSPSTPTSTTSFEGTVTYTCNNGYWISPGVTIATASCLNTGNWETVPTCLVIDCGPLTAPPNGGVNVPVTTFINTATYSCNAGYILAGDMSRTCGSDGMWTLAEPSCISVRVVPSADDPPTAGQSYSITCTVTGADSLNLTISYQWTRGSTIVGTNATLTFDPLLLSDTGQYRCELTLSSNLLSKNMRAVSDIFDLEIPTVFIQLLFRGIPNCLEYRPTNANGIIQDITNGLTEAIQDLCRCGLTSNHVSKSFLQCFSDAPEQIAFRAQLNQTTQATTEELVSYIDQWVRNPGRLVVQGSLLQLNSTCSLVITDQFVSSECPTPLSRDQPTTGAVGTLPSSAPPSSQSDNTGAILATCAVVVILSVILLAVTAVIIAYLVLKQRRKGGVDLKTPDVPLTDRGQSSSVPTYDTVDVAYEEVGVPRPLKESYEYSHCEAYVPTPGGGVVNVVGTNSVPVTST